MSLFLQVIRCPDNVAPERREVSGGDFSIGRGPDNDWILADPDRYMSKRHCQVIFQAGQWRLADLSSNGTFLNHGPAPLGQGQAKTLRDGDRIVFGAYEIEVQIRDDAAAFDRLGQASPFENRISAKTGRSTPEYEGRYADSLDPFAEPPPARPFNAPADRFVQSDDLHGVDGVGRGVRLPPDFDPLAAPEDLFQGPTQPDHAPALDQAFHQSRPAHAIPDDWDLDAPAPPAPAQPIPAPPPPTAAPAATPTVSQGELLTAFLRGTGMDEVAVADPVRTMELLGAALRAAVSGVRQALIARASIKSEFRIEQTMIRITGNNPLKFSAGDDDALAAFLGSGRRNTMPPAEALAEALRDMRLHELATVTAMQAAVRIMLAQFDPANIEAQAEKNGRAMLPGQRKARSWDTFAAMHAKVSQALSDDFDSVFGKNFARAYEQAMSELSYRKDLP